MRYLTLLLASACGGAAAGGAGSSAVVRDSAGIQIVENGAPAWAEGAGWRIVDSPLVSIGGVAGDPAYDLNQINSVVQLGDGRVAVAVAGASEVRYYDASGTHLKTSGRRGGGPGEFQTIGGFYPAAGDSMLVFDILSRRLTLLDGAGAVARTFSLGGEGGGAFVGFGGRMSFPLPAGVFSDGSILAVALPFTLNDERTGSFRDTAAYIRFGPDGAIQDTVSRQPGIEMETMSITFGAQTMSAPTPVPLGRNTMVGLEGDRIVVAKNARWELEVYDGTGRLVRLIRVDQDPRAITPEHVAAHRAWSKEQMMEQPMLRNAPEQIRKQVTDRVDQATYPSEFPFIEAILSGGDGHLWVQEQGDPGDERRRFAVLDSTGQLLGRVIMPDRFRPTHIRGDRMAGIWRDQDDVEFVRVYRVLKP